MRELEFVALPGTVFLIEETRDDERHRVYRVTTADYPYPTTKGYYIDSRLVAVMAARPVERIKLLPQKEEIISALLAAEGSRYVWGGNLRQGLPELLRLYPPPPGPLLTEELLARWQLRGVDCSGLLYEATGGYTPRNTSALISFGKGVSVAGLTAAEISRKVEPLDLIVWNGHVMIILDRERVIESRLDCGEEKGVMVSRLEVALARVIQRRVPVDEYGEAVAEGKQKFVVRRWYDLSR